MSKRSRAQRDIERNNRERLAMAQDGPNKLTFPESCSTPKCAGHAILAVIIKKAHGQFKGWSGCKNHIQNIFDVVRAMDQTVRAVAMIPATPAEPSENAPVLEPSDTSTSGEQSPQA